MMSLIERPSAASRGVPPLLWSARKPARELPTTIAARTSWSWTCVNQRRSFNFFVIVTATSRRQSHAMAGEIDHAMKKCGEAKLGIEGSEEGRWTLIDYGDFVVHVFSPEDRAYYALEEIWGDAPQLDWQASPSANHERS